ncbi:chitin synthase [Paramecium bursaria Chlorella virus CvsA1]|uniref:Chitin synthase n=1 Tax=Paramecium bursaria Chlorella virus CVK2 TaxID=31555 RepID=Q33DL0_9PHYC|nr:chitin synthase [Paramecium bursaria Chlorella virus CvsA1]BAE48153.1 chitin synthase [Paramecium bursaria Chlorella virus CVK2]
MELQSFVVKLQSLILVLFLIALNGALISTSLIFKKEGYWWVYTIILMIPVTMKLYYVLINALFAIFKLGYYKEKHPFVYDKSKKFFTLVPAYREDKTELLNTLNSVKEQNDIEGINTIVVICDGDFEAASAAREIFDDGISLDISEAYHDWRNEPNDVELRKGVWNNINYILIVKKRNVGKRDSLVVVRTLAYNQLNNTSDYALKMKPQLINFWNNNMPKTEYIIGTDADTHYKKDAFIKMLNDIDGSGADGAVGYIHVDNVKSGFWVWYQRVEYAIAQHIRRMSQSRVYERVSCLSGAFQILRINTTCTTEILKKFNTPPNDYILYSLLVSLFSEDRRHCLEALRINNKLRFRQVIDAVSFTTPPVSLSVFLSQRRRWSLGASFNEAYMALSVNTNIFERLWGLVDGFVLACVPFYVFSIVMLLYTVITDFKITMLYFGITMIVNWVIDLSIAIWSPAIPTEEKKYFPLQFIVFIIGAPWVCLSMFIYTFATSYKIKWGKTTVKETK